MFFRVILPQRELQRFLLLRRRLPVATLGSFGRRFGRSIMFSMYWTFTFSGSKIGFLMIFSVQLDHELQHISFGFKYAIWGLRWRHQFLFLPWVLTHSCSWNLHLQDVHLAAENFVIQKGPTEQEDLLSVTLCSLGSAEAYLAQDPKATLLKPQHAWHHPASWQNCFRTLPSLIK